MTHFTSKQIASVALLLCIAGSPTFAAESIVPSDLAKDGFREGSALSFLVEWGGGWPVLKRPTNHLPQETYNGAAETVFAVAFDEAASPKAEIRSGGWDHQQVAWPLAGGGEAAMTYNRLSPAVLFDSAGSSVFIRRAGTSTNPPAKGKGAARVRAPKGAPGQGAQRAAASPGALPKFVAWLKNGKPAVHAVADLAGLKAGDLAMDEPWMLLWFGAATPVRGHATYFDIEEVEGISKPKLAASVPDALDVPILVRLEHKVAALAFDESKGLSIRLDGKAGKIALMPLMGGRVYLAEDTEAWKNGLPGDVLAQGRFWSKHLRDFPTSVKETFSSDSEKGTVTVRQEFQWLSFNDDWKTPSVKAAPIPPMLAMALGGGVPVRFLQNGKEIKPLDGKAMDIAGKAMMIVGADGYEYEISGLNESLRAKERTAALAPAAKPLQQKLEQHVGEMIAAGHLAPLFYIYGGIGSTWFSHFYWVGSPELAQALGAAYPPLSPPLQEKVKEYLKQEWKGNPPFQISQQRYRTGAPRIPYDIPWDDMSRNLGYAVSRDTAFRQANFLHDLYGVSEYYALTGEKPDGALREKAMALVRELLANQDWAIMGPPRIRTAKDIHSIFYYNLQGQATYNRWLAGAIGLTRLAERFGWKEEESLGRYLVAKLALARVAQARYVAEMHRMGVVRGSEGDDNRTLLHLDTTCAVIGRGPLATIVHQNQEIPPFYDLAEEVGRLLGRHARAECKIYLDHLDYSMPLWYLSEAPKQSATEQRLCPLQHYNGNVLAQYWVLGKRGADFARYVDTTRFKGDLYYIRNLAAAIESFGGREYNGD